MALIFAPSSHRVLATLPPGLLAPRSRLSLASFASLLSACPVCQYRIPVSEAGVIRIPCSTGFFFSISRLTPLGASRRNRLSNRPRPPHRHRQHHRARCHLPAAAADRLSSCRPFCHIVGLLPAGPLLSREPFQLGPKLRVEAPVWRLYSCDIIPKSECPRQPPTADSQHAVRPTSSSTVSNPTARPFYPPVPSRVHRIHSRVASRGDTTPPNCLHQYFFTAPSPTRRAPTHRVAGRRTPRWLTRAAGGGDLVAFSRSTTNRSSRSSSSVTSQLCRI